MSIRIVRDLFAFLGGVAASSQVSAVSIFVGVGSGHTNMAGLERSYGSSGRVSSQRADLMSVRAIPPSWIGEMVVDSATGSSRRAVGSGTIVTGGVSGPKLVGLPNHWPRSRSIFGTIPGVCTL